MSQAIKEPSIYRINRKLVREIAKLGHKFTTSTGSVGHLLPFVIVRNDELPMDQYRVIDFKDMPDDALANIGLQKIPENQPIITETTEKESL